MIQKILEQGDPMLHMLSDEVTLADLASPEVQQLILDMKHTLRASKGIGLAAPQIGHLRRIIVVNDPQMVFVNPVLTPVGDEQECVVEGCLSVPGMTGEVMRYKTVRVQAMDPQGSPIDMTCTKLRAVVLQHEVDHLNGTLYTERATNMLTKGASPHEAPPKQDGTKKRVGGKTFVIDSERAVGGNQFVAWTFLEKGKIVEMRISPPSAIVRGIWLSGMRLRSGFKASDINEKIGRALHVGANDQLRIELQISKGKKRIMAEVDFDAE